MILEHLSINLPSIMNPKDTKKSNCRSRESLKRRRKQRKMKKKEKVRETASAGRCQEGDAFQNDYVESLTTRNLELKGRLEEETKKRKVLQSENLDLCRRLEKRQKTDFKLSNISGTYTAQVHRTIESSKKQPLRSPVVRRIDQANLTLQEKTPCVLGEGSFGCVKKMLYRDMEVAVKILKGNASERELMREANVMHEIGDHPGVPFLYGVCVRDTHFMLVMQYCSQDGKVVTLSDAAGSQDLSNFSWLQILICLTEALIFIHKKGFVHNDLKGNNVLLCKHERMWQPVIIDYGKSVRLSGAQAKQNNSAQSSCNLIKKRCSHTAPEVFSGQQPPSCASDIYSLGIIFQKVNAKLHCTVVPSDIVVACCHNNPSLRVRDALLLDKLNSVVKGLE